MCKCYVFVLNASKMSLTTFASIFQFCLHFIKLSFKHSSFKVFAVDCRNHGLSPHVDEMNYRVMSLDMARSPREEGLSEVDMIGHSMGGKVAMMYALSLDLVR